MIYIATVHWQTDEWIDIQLTYLKRFLNEPYRVYAFLNSISTQHYSKFDYVCDEPIEDHGIKLNLLAQIICLQANEEDVIIFMDGDAFPIAPLAPFLKDSLSTYPLVSVVRAENLSDRHPHPSFCATTVGFWKELKGDWKLGYCWTDSTGMLVSDTGANLLQKLEENSIKWLPLYRSESLGNHPLWYGIYHSLIYHHGAGFRTPAERIGLTKSPFWLKYLWLAISKSRSLTEVLSRAWDKAEKKYVSKENISARNAMYQYIKKEKDFFIKPLQK